MNYRMITKCRVGKLGQDGSWQTERPVGMKDAILLSNEYIDKYVIRYTSDQFDRVQPFQPTFNCYKGTGIFESPNPQTPKPYR